MTLASGLLLTCFLAYKIQKRPTQLCLLILISPLLVICFPVILFISKVRGAFTNYVDENLPVIDQLTTYTCLVNVVCECTLML